MRNKYLVETLVFTNGSSPRPRPNQIFKSIFPNICLFQKPTFIYKSHNNFNFPHQVNKRIY